MFETPSFLQGLSSHPNRPVVPAQRTKLPPSADAPSSPILQGLLATLVSTFFLAACESHFLTSLTVLLKPNAWCIVPGVSTCL